MNLAHLLLLTGKLAEGWPEYEWRWETREFVRRIFEQPAWQGEPLAGKTILVHTEQGFGDTIQFIRYAELLKERGARVVALCQTQLTKLISRLPAIDQLLSIGEPMPAFDVHVPLLSLPFFVGTTLSSIPARIPYLFAAPQLLAHWRAKLAAYRGYKVGIVWRGNPDYKQDALRSIPLAAFAPLAGVPGVTLFSLQKGKGAEEIAQVAERLAVVDLGPDIDDFADTAAAIMNLDLVISCDTSVAHLSGAMGRPTWCVLPHIPASRWLLDRSDSPWYPTMRLFRRTAGQAWDSVFEHIAVELAALP